MAKKKQRKKARSRKANPKKRKTAHRRKRHKRAALANPIRRRRRARRANPSHKRRTYRAKRRNPSPIRRRTHRRSRRNPGGPVVDALLAVLAGGAAFAATTAISYVATPASDLITGYRRNQMIVGGLLAAGGIYLAAKGHVGVGTAMAAGSLLAAFKDQISTKVFALLPAKQPTAPSNTAAVFADPMAAVFADPMAAVFSDSMRGIGGYAQIGSGYEQIGAYAPAAPWLTPTPFSN